MEKNIWRCGLGVKSVLSSLCAVVVILFSSILVAEQIAQSTLYRQSAFVSSLFSQDTLGARSFLSRENLSLLQKFVGAVTDAYINFELIPVNEVNTFGAIYESLNEEITVDRFAYHRKNLTIYGSATSQEGYEQFAKALEETGHFESVAGFFYISTDDAFQFELECSSAPSGSYLDFVQQ